jgi:long-chain acyl-CoA synthetase
VIDDSGPRSWAGFEATVAEIAEDLADGDGPVGILLPSGAEFLATFLACSLAGRAGCTLHPDWAEPELKAAIEDAGVTRLVTDRETCVRLPEPSAGNPNGVRSGDHDEDPVFYVGFTSGTSGRPKPFARRTRSWVSSFAPAAELFSVGRGDIVYLPGSMSNSHFLFGAVFTLNRGAAVRLSGRYSAEALAGALVESDGAVVYLVPTMIHDLEKTGIGPFAKVRSVVVSGAKMEPRHWQAARRLFPNAKVSEIYGASELSFVTVATGGREGDPGYVGRPFPGVEIEVRPLGTETGGRAEERAEGRAGEPGLVFARSPYLFDGYIEGSVTVSPVGPDGFITVGDVGILSPRGLSLSGRASNMLITGGRNVHPEEVEAALARHPAVAENVVIGMPHERWGEQLVAFVAFGDSPGRPGADQLRAFLKSRVAGYKVPKRWFEVEALPRTPAGKFDRSAGRLLEAADEL